jgi:thymidylate kinase
MYIIFEGADGVGKSSLAKSYAEYINAKYTYEPFGYSDEVAGLRKLALTKNVPFLAREYLLLANRDIGYQDLKLWLATSHVVSDRSFVSGMVYAAMEGMSPETWLQLASPLLQQLSTPPVFVLCQNKQYKNKDNPEDRYDGRGSEFHDQVGQKFVEIFDYLKIKPLLFNIDFAATKEENLNRFIEEIDCYLGLRFAGTGEFNEVEMYPEE